MTVNLLIRDVPEAVRDTLAARANARHQSMQAYMRDLVTAEARRSKNLDLLRHVRTIGKGITDSQPSDVVEMLAQQRSERVTELVSPADSR